ESRAPALFVLLFEKNFALKVERDRSDADLERSLIRRVVDPVDRFHSGQRLRHFRHVHEKIPERLSGGRNDGALAEFHLSVSPSVRTSEASRDPRALSSARGARKLRPSPSYRRRSRENR